MYESLTDYYALLRKCDDVEKLAKEKPPDGMTIAEQAYCLRQDKNRPILDAFHAWLKHHEGEAESFHWQSHWLCDRTGAVFAPLC